MDVLVPDLGDFADVEVIEILVQPGDTVALEDSLITLETEKAAMDVPAPAAGTVREVKVSAGSIVSQGDLIVVLEPAAEDAGANAAAKRRDTADAPMPTATAGPASVSAVTPSAATAVPKSHAAAGSVPLSFGAIDEGTFSRAHASPSVRKLSRELGVDLGRVRGSGHKGRVTADDVKAFVKEIMLGGGTRGAALPAVPTVDFAKFGLVETQKLSRIQKISGPRLHASWVNIPHVTQHDEADITRLEEMRQSLKAEAAQRGIKLTPLAFIMRACVLVLADYPQFRSSLSSDGESLVIKQYSHLGFAADTPNGLVVPVIRDADKKDVYEIATELAELSALAREGKLKPDQLQGGVFTI